ncbi:hypothetical protein BRD05_02875 [Halobacteriales archaeon QS_9_70_65]|nr:MAG: hypothetical protein BRD05_02875 [Halobacteriales archaeon QS_9_70_65]
MESERRPDRLPVPNPYVVFEGRPATRDAGAGDVRADEGVADLRWAETVPESLLCDESAELALPDFS